MALNGRSPCASGAARSASSLPHKPVMLREVIDALAVTASGRYIDATFGAGGYTRAILEATDCKVLALDRDPSAAVAGFPFVMQNSARLSLMNVRFSIMLRWAENHPDEWPGRFDGIVFDLGVSSMQLDRPERGFSFQSEGPLDMRMSAAGKVRAADDEGVTAADLVNTLQEHEIAAVLYHYGEERRSRALARAIVAARRSAPIQTTRQLAEIVTRVLGSGGRDGKHPATRTFQALRIAVNHEFDELIAGLAGAERLLKPGGRLVVVSFHSLEDRIVKRFLNERAGKSASASRHLPETVQLQPPSLRLVYQKALTAGNQELAENPRSRSAKLRAAERCDAPAWPLDPERLGVPRA